MELEAYIYDKLVTILKSYERHVASMCAIGLVIEFPDGDPWRSHLYILFGMTETRRLREEYPANQGMIFGDKWCNLADCIFWSPPTIDQLMPDVEGMALRDAYLGGFADSDTLSLCRALVDACARVVRRLHATPALEVGKIPIVLETLGAQPGVQEYAMVQGVSANSPELSAEYKALLIAPRHRDKIENAVAEIRRKVEFANTIVKELTEHLAACRIKDPIPKLPDLSPVERQQYQIIRDGLKEWFVKIRDKGRYDIRVFGTCRPGLVAFAELAPANSATVFCLLREEYSEYARDKDWAFWNETPHSYRAQSFDPPNLSIEPVNDGDCDRNDDRMRSLFPISEGYCYWMEHMEYWSSGLVAGSRVHLWKADDQTMTLIEEDIMFSNS